MTENQMRTIRHHEAQLLGAAQRYCALADWFESRRRSQKVALEAEQAAMLQFNKVEHELREAGRRLLQATGMRADALRAAGVKRP